MVETRRDGESSHWIRIWHNSAHPWGQLLGPRAFDCSFRNSYLGREHRVLNSVNHTRTQFLAATMFECTPLYEGRTTDGT